MSIEILATVLFGIAIAHTFSVKIFQHLALQFPEGSVGENFFHLLGEVEIVFGVWAAVLICVWAIVRGPIDAIQFVESANFTEPLFVFAIMAVAATRPVLDFGKQLVGVCARVLPLPGEVAFFASTLIIGPLLGSFITEPAAMTVTALILKDRYYSRKMSDRFMYLALGVLFVNISIGGVLTPFAAPPVLMVAKTWSWDLRFMMVHFGWKALIAVVLNTLFVTALCFRELKALDCFVEPPHAERPAPVWLKALHLLFLSLIVLTSHYPTVFLGLFLFFIGLTTITKEFQEELRLKEGLLVAFFLGGLVLLGGQQRWWLDPLIRGLTDSPMFLGAAALTAFTDNAALTFLGSQIPGLSDSLKYALVAGAVAGGGLTVIANAPNPAGFAILRESFGNEGISPARLFLGALIPTLFAMGCFWWL